MVKEWRVSLLIVSGGGKYVYTISTRRSFYLTLSGVGGPLSRGSIIARREEKIQRRSSPMIAICDHREKGQEMRDGLKVRAPFEKGRGG